MIESESHSNPPLIFLKDALMFLCYNIPIKRKGKNKMTEQEKIAKLIEKTSVTEEEARAALEANGWDLLDAIVALERAGKVSGGTAQHSTKEETASSEPESEQRSRFSQNAASFRSQLRNILRICTQNHFVIHHKENQVISMPITILIILVLCLNAWGVIALLAGLFFGLRYSIVGKELGKPAVNDAMDKAANAAENVRETVEDSLRKEK